MIMKANEVSMRDCEAIAPAPKGRDLGMRDCEARAIANAMSVWHPYQLVALCATALPERQQGVSAKGRDLAC